MAKYIQTREPNLKFIRVPGKVWEFTTAGFVQPITYDMDNQVVNIGVTIAPPYTSTIVDEYGNEYLRDGTILKKTTGVDPLDGITKNYWTPVVSDADIATANTVLVLEYVTLVRSGDGEDNYPLVSAYRDGSFWAKRLPGITNQATLGLSAAAMTNMRGHGFRFGEDYATR